MEGELELVEVGEFAVETVLEWTRWRWELNLQLCCQSSEAVQFRCPRSRCVGSDTLNCGTTWKIPACVCMYVRM